MEVWVVAPAYAAGGSWGLSFCFLSGLFVFCFDPLSSSDGGFCCGECSNRDKVEKRLGCCWFCL